MLLAAALGACAPVQTQAAPAGAPLNGVSVEVKSWGATLRKWSVDASGNVEHVKSEQIGSDRGHYNLLTRRLTLSPEQRSALNAAVVQVETQLALPEGCENMLTDGPYGTITWNRGTEQKLPFSANCMKGRDYDLASAIFAADELVDDASLATQPVETKEVDLRGR
ncbi:MAG: hypothetical protein ACJ8EY_00120 [Sphingomicrobium sp.]